MEGGNLVPIQLITKPKSKPTVLVRKHPAKLWRYLLSFPWSPLVTRIAKEIKKYPGYSWDPVRTVWEVSAEVWDSYLRKVFTDLKYVVDEPDAIIVPSNMLPKVFLPHQVAGVSNIYNKGVYLLAYEQGLGKTATAIEAGRMICERSGNIFYVGPSKGISGIAIEFKKWWPECQIVIVDKPNTTLAWDNSKPAVIMFTWNNLHKFATHPEYKYLIIDEVEKGKNPGSKSGKAIRKLRNDNYDKYVVALSATPCPQGIHDYWNVFNMLLPNNWGSYWRFGMHYGEYSENEHGKKLTNLRDTKTSELSERLSYWAQHQDKRGLPVPTINTAQILIPNNIPAIGDLNELTKEVVEDYLVKYSFDKISRSFDYIDKVINSGHDHNVILCWKHETAQAMYNRLIAEGYTDAHYIDGTMPIPKRIAYIDEIATHESSVIVVTMECIAESLNNLVFVSNICFIELMYKTRILSQVIGRFVRLNSLHTEVDLKFVLMENTVEVDIATRIGALIESNAAVIGKGVTEGALLQGLENTETAEDFADRIGGLVVWELGGSGVDDLGGDW